MEKKKIIFGLALAVVMFCAFADDDYKEPKFVKNKESIVSHFIDFNLFEDLNIESDCSNRFPDTTISYEKTNGWGITYKVYPFSQCCQSPAYIYYKLHSAIDTSSKWPRDYYSETEYYNEGFKNTFKNYFGKDILKEKIKINSVDYNRFPNTINVFNADAIQAVFDSLYKKPGTMFKNISYQKIYDITLKKFCRESAKIISDVLKNKAGFEKWAGNYKKAATENSEFRGTSYAYDAYKSILGENYVSEGYCVGPSYIIGTMMRRQLDGTLSVLLKCFKKILQDYDPVYYKEVKDKF